MTQGIAVVLHGAVDADARPDEQDTLVQAAAVSEALIRLGYGVERVHLTLDLAVAADRLRRIAPAVVFNLVESVAGRDSLLPLGPMLLDSLGLPYTGCPTRALVASGDKLLAKRLMRGAGIPTPAWVENAPAVTPDKREARRSGVQLGRVTGTSAGDSRSGSLGPASLPQHGSHGAGGAAALDPGFRRGDKGSPRRAAVECGRARAEARGDGPFAVPPPDNIDRFIVKSVTEHASFGLDASAVVAADEIPAALADRRARFGGEWFAEAYIHGREFNLSLLAGPAGPQALPPAEIAFRGFAPGEPRIVGYAAKWDEGSQADRNTPRRVQFDAADAGLLDRLSEIAIACWHVFGLSGYARVDFRVNEAGEAFVLEVNANPCLSPGAGFMAAAERAGLAFVDVIARIAAAARA